MITPPSYEHSQSPFEHSVLHIRLFGDFLLSYDNEPVTSIDLHRMRSLLAYLVLHHDAPQERSHLAFLLWPESTDAQALGNLRTLLHRLRNVLPDAERLLYVGRHTLQWRPNRLWRLDITEFEQAIAQAKQAQQAHALEQERLALELAVALYRGDLFPSCYDEWILPERDRLFQMHLSALQQLTIVLEHGQNYSAAIQVMQRLIQCDPLQEEHYRHLMHLYERQKDNASAIRVYRACEDILRRELDIVPSPTTSMIYERLTRQSDVASSKTLLSEEFLGWLRQQAYATKRVRDDEGIPSSALAVLLKTEAAQEALLSLANVWLMESARVLPEVFIQYPDQLRSTSPTKHQQRQRFFEALAHAMLYTPLML